MYFQIIQGPLQGTRISMRSKSLIKAFEWLRCSYMHREGNVYVDELVNHGVALQDMDTTCLFP